MLLLDTNVVSALMRVDPFDALVRWADRQPASELWTSAITCYEIRFGIMRLPDGHKRAGLQIRFEDSLADFQGRIAAVDAVAADAAARLDAERRARGIVIDLPDTLIAGIAIANRAIVVTRNIRHFADAGVPVVDPFSA